MNAKKKTTLSSRALTEERPGANAPGKSISGFHNYIDTAFGSPVNRNHVVSIDGLEIPDDVTDCYTGMYRFEEEYKHICDQTDSVSGSSHLPCWSDYLWFDIDDSDLTAALVAARQLVINIERIDPALTLLLAIYFSGRKGFHIGIPSPLFGFEPSVDLPRIHKAIALELAGEVKIDTSIYEHNRLWRVPNTRHSKSGLFKVRLTYEQLSTWTVKQIKDFAAKPTGKPALTEPATISDSPHPALTEMYHRVKEGSQQEAATPKARTDIPQLVSNLTEGNRNLTFASIIGRLRKDGWEADEILPLLRPMAADCDFPLAELEREIKGICDRYPPTVPVSDFPPIYSEQSEIGTFGVQPLSEFMSSGDAEINWRVEKLFPAVGVGILASPAGYGKTWMLIDLAIECARGGHWLGQFPVQKGSVLYIDEESHDTLLRSRLTRMLAAKRISDDDLDIDLSVMGGLCLTKPNSFECLQGHLQTLKPDVVIIDCLTRVHHAEENSAKEMSRLLDKVKELVCESQCLFIFVDHQRKPGIHESGQADRLRGSSDKVAFVDTLISLKKRHNRLIVEHTKSRFAIEVPSFAITIEDPTEDTTEIVYHGDAKTLNTQDQLAEIAEHLDDILPEEDWISRQELVELAKDQKIPEKALARGLKAFVEQKALEREDRRTDGTRGGKTAYFRRSFQFPISSLYIRGDRKTESQQDGAA